LCHAVFPYFTVYIITLRQQYGINVIINVKSGNDAKKSCKVMAVDENKDSRYWLLLWGGFV
jgi:hypothetical protein